jgi:hypothetical protein
MFLRLFPRNEEYRSGSDVPRGTRVGTLREDRERVQHIFPSLTFRFRIPPV